LKVTVKRSSLYKESEKQDREEEEEDIIFYTINNPDLIALNLDKRNHQNGAHNLNHLRSTLN